MIRTICSIALSAALAVGIGFLPLRHPFLEYRGGGLVCSLPGEWITLFVTYLLTGLLLVSKTSQQ